MTDPAPLRKACGVLRVGLRQAEDGQTSVVDLFQQGCLKARLPRPQRAGEADLVVLNIAGGLTGGDHLSIEVAVAAGARATVTTPGCERAYRSAAGVARIDQCLRVDDGGRLDWLPQEMILYERSRTRRRLDVELQGCAEISIVESVLLGRAAMGERLTHGCFSDFWKIRRDERLIYADATRIDDSFGQTVACPTALGGQAAMTSLVHVGSDLVVKRNALRAAFAACGGIRAGASVVGEVLVARIVAPGGRELRRALAAAVESLRHPRPIPRLWFC